MVNLIIALISIALIAIVAGAALYNGGDAFRQGSAKASASQLVNAGQQISAANVLYSNDEGGTYAPDLATLTADGEYLSSIPRVPDSFEEPTLSTDNVITINGTSQEICEAVNSQNGLEGVVTSEASSIDDAQYGCYGADGAFTFEFK